MKLVGMKKQDGIFKNERGQDIAFSGYGLNFTYEDKKTAGLAVQYVYAKDEAIQDELVLGEEYAVSYNKFKKVQSVVKV